MSVFNFRIKIFKSWPKSLLGHLIFSGISDAFSDIYNTYWACIEKRKQMAEILSLEYRTRLAKAKEDAGETKAEFG